MHLQKALISLSWASLATAYAVQPAGSSESIHVFSDYADTDIHAMHVQTLFDSLGGTFRFLTEDGQYSSVSAIHLYKDATKYDGGGNRTTSLLDGVNDIFNLEERSFGGGLEARAPIQVNGRACAKEGQYGDHAISAAAQRNLNAKFCNFLDTLTPSFWAVVGLTFSNLACGTRASPAQFVCQGIWSISAAVAGQYISKAIEDNCLAQLNSLDGVCGTEGGQQQNTVSGNKVIVEAFATTESGNDCPPKSGKGGNRCNTFTCRNKNCSNKS